MTALTATLEDLQARLLKVKESHGNVLANLHAHNGSIEELERLITAEAEREQGEEETPTPKLVAAAAPKRKAATS